MPSAQTSPASARPRRGDVHRRRGLCQRDHRRCPLTRAVAAAAPSFAACASAHAPLSPPCPAPARPRAPSTGARRRRRCAEPRCPRKGALRAIAPVQPRASRQRRPCKRECRPPAHVAAAAAPSHRTRATASAAPAPPVQAREPRHRRHVRGASVETPRKPVLRRPPIPLRRPIPRKLPPHCGNRFRESPSLAAVASLPTVFRIPFCRTTISPITKRTVRMRNTTPRNGAPFAPSAPPTRPAYTLR